MPISSAQITLTTSAALVHQADADGCHIVISNHEGTGSEAYLGAAGVTTSTGHRLDGKDSLNIVLTPGAAVYGVAASGTISISKIVSN